MATRSHQVLFVCVGNSARSILAEALLNHLGKGRFRAFSAGSNPARGINPYVLELLGQQGIPTEPLYCKSWSEFSDPGVAPVMNSVITLSAQAAALAPVWPGRPAIALWALRDPTGVSGPPHQKREAFRHVFEELQVRIQHLVALPVERLHAGVLQARLEWIGRVPTNDAKYVPPPVGY